jgi:hypothetical protein
MLRKREEDEENNEGDADEAKLKTQSALKLILVRTLLDCHHCFEVSIPCGLVSSPSSD